MTIPQDRYYQRFEAVFSDHYGPLCNYAFTFVKSAELSEDIVQEVFTRIWANKKELIITDAVRYYLYTAVRNNCISHLRKEKVSAVTPLNEEIVAHGLVLNEGFTKSSQDGELDYEKLLQEAIELLPPKCREVFVLSRLSNMKYKEIADSLDISIKTVENQLGKALKMIRAFLKQRGVPLAWILAYLFV